MVAGLAAGLVLTACAPDEGAQQTPDATTETTTETTTGTTAETSATPGAVVEWVDGFCGAVNGFLAGQNALAAPSTGGTLEDSQRDTSAHLGGFVKVLDKAIAALAALPPAPDPTAETAVRTARKNYTIARDTAATAKTELDAADPNDIESQNRAADALIKVQGHAHKSIDPVGPLTESPELVDAAAIAPNCL